MAVPTPSLVAPNKFLSTQSSLVNPRTQIQHCTWHHGDGDAVNVVPGHLVRFCWLLVARVPGGHKSSTVEWETYQDPRPHNEVVLGEDANQYLPSAFSAVENNRSPALLYTWYWGFWAYWSLGSGHKRCLGGSLVTHSMWSVLESHDLFNELKKKLFQIDTSSCSGWDVVCEDDDFLRPKKLTPPVNS